MKLLTKASGTAIYGNDSDLYVCHVGGNGLKVFRYVVMLVTLIAAAGSIGFLFEGNMEAGSIFATLSIAGFALVRLLNGQLAKANQATYKDLPLIFRLNRTDQNLYGAGDQLICGVSQARLAYKFQATSSSKALELLTPAGALMIARGNPFAGGTDPLVAILQTSGLTGP